MNRSRSNPASADGALHSLLVGQQAGGRRLGRPAWRYQGNRAL